LTLIVLVKRINPVPSVAQSGNSIDDVAATDRAAQSPRPVYPAPALSVYRPGVNGSATARAECLLTRRVILGDFDVDAEFAGEQAETAGNGRRHTAEGRSRQGLTVRAMTQQHLLGVDFGCEGDIATMAGTVNFHFLFHSNLVFKSSYIVISRNLAARSSTIIQRKIFRKLIDSAFTGLPNDFSCRPQT
jgi:hypothetical protein